MKEKLILPLNNKWSDPAETEAEIQHWENVNKIILPKDYRNFMIKYDGGHPYPLLFKIDQKFSSDFFLDRIYEWSFAEQIFHGKIFNKTVMPSNMLFIGSDPGGVEIVMPIEKNFYGQIFAWFHSLETWGQEGNNSLYPLGLNFKDFISRLFEDEQQEGKSHWEPIRDNRLERKLEL